MAVERPPDVVINAVERGVPGIWNWWVGAVNRAHSQSSPWFPTSWWRSRAKNLSVGGHPFSQHLLGLAFDLWEPETATRSAPDSPEAALRGQGFIVLRKAQHLHVQTWPAGSGRGLIRSLGLG